MRLNLKINKRYLRSIKTNIIFYVAASLLTMLSVMAFALLYTSGIGIRDYVNKIFEENVVEDASFQSLVPVYDEDIQYLEETHHILVERQEYLNIMEVKTIDKNGADTTTKNTHARVFKNNTKINKYTITASKNGITNVEQLKDNEIIINEKYANRHNISLDSDKNKIILLGKEYTIVGYFIRPDYISCREEETDSYPNYDSFLIAYLNSNSYQAFVNEKDGIVAAASLCAIKYNQNGQTDISALRDDLFNKYITYQYNVAQTSGRIKILYERPKMYISFSFLFLAIIPIAVVSLIAIILNIKIKNDQKIIGTIKALGYQESEICYHYSIMSLIPGLTGGILMTIIIYISVNFFGKLASGDFEVMKINFVYPWYTALLGILVPTIIYVIASIITAKILINKPTTDLLRGASTKSKSSNVLVHKRMKITNKHAIRSLLINKGRAFVVILGIAASTLVITLGFMMFDTIDAIVSQAMKKAGDFEYEYTLKMPGFATDEELHSKETNYMIATIYEANNRKIPLMGAGLDNINLWYTTLTDGTEIKELNDNTFYMSKLCAELMHVNVGDEVEIHSNFNESVLKFKLTGIIDNGLLSYIITSKGNVIKSYLNTIKEFISQPDYYEGFDQAIRTEIINLLNDNTIDGNNTSLYNIVLSKNALNDQFDASNLLNIFQKSSIEKQKDAKLAERTPIIYTVLIIGILICIIAVFTVVNVIIEDNQGNISMLMVLGYKRNEINRMIIDGNHILVPIAIAIGMPLAYLILRLYFKATVPNNNMIIPVTISLKTVFIVIGTIVVTYLGTLVVLKKKASMVSMTDSLKDNR